MIGRTVSHYRIIAELGRGGMGVVYRAEDLNLDRIVAIKFLPPAASRDPASARRFVQEAKAASSLDHPGIAVIHEIGQTDEGQTFIVMGYYDGGSLRAKLDSELLPLPVALDLVVQVSGGLAQAHRRGIVHRDIKPGNILLTADGDAKIIDFGLAKLTDQTRLTRTGATMGTLGYMAPEQLHGAEVDHRADIFALGAVLYELVAGQPPFQGDSEATLLYAVAHKNPPPLNSVSKNVPRGLQQIVDRALAKDPDERYQNIEDLQRDLEIVRTDLTPDKSRLWNLVFRAGTLSHKTKVWRIAALVLAGMLSAAGVYVVLNPSQRVQPPEEPALAVMDFRDLSTPDDLTVTTGVTSLVHVGLVESSPIRVVSPEYLYDLRRRLFGAERGPIEEDQALEVARKSGASLLLSGQMATLGEARFITWRLVETLGGRTVAARRVEGANWAQMADRMIAEVLPLIASQSGVTAPGITASVSDLTTASPQAYQYFVAGVLARDAWKAQEAVQNFEAAIAIDSTFSLALLELSRIYYTGTEAGVDYGLAYRHADGAWAHRKRLGVKDRLRLEAWREQLDYQVADAIDTYEELLDRWPDDREILNNYHRILFHYWYSDRALEVATQGRELYPDDLYFGLFYQIGLAHQLRMQEALAATRQYLQQHPREPNAWDELAMRYLSLGLPDSAEVAYRQALDIDPHFLPSLEGLGYCAYSRGDLDQAIANHAEILQQEDLLPSQRVDLLTANAFWPGLAFYHAEAGRYQRALSYFDEAKQYVSDPVSELRLESGRARMWLLMGRPDEVLRWTTALKTHPAKRLAPLVGVQFRAQALVALDSLTAARAAVEELHATEAAWGGVARREALMVTAQIALAEHQPEVALTTLTEIARHGILDGGYVDQQYRQSKAHAHRLAGRYDEAVRLLQDLLQVYGSHALAHHQLGLTYEEMGRTGDARREYQTFLETWDQADPNLPEILDARQRLAWLSSAP